jgi:uncharacterized coiled-coil protein SlyX
MKNRIKILVSAVFLAPLFTVGVALAVDEPVTTTTETETSQNQMSAAQKQKMEQRVKERKDAAKLRLTNTEQTRIKNRCANAQGVVRNVEGRINGIQTSRTQVYGNLVDRLTKLEARLAANSIDTAELKSQITTLQEKIEKFNTDLTAYKDAVSDVAAMDCTTDPVAFKASLEAARTARQQLKADGEDIKLYVNDTIKVTLKAIRQALAAETTTETSDETEEDTTTDTTETETGGNE